MPERTSRSQVTMLLTACTLMFCSGAAPVSNYAKEKPNKDKLKDFFKDAATEVVKSVVRVKCEDKDVALGTIVGKSGLIITKGSELNGKITCDLADGTLYDAKQLAYHKESDIALLKIDADNLTPIVFKKESVDVGDWVAVIGNKSDPIINAVVSVGVVSVKARELFGDQAEIANLNKGYLGVQLEDAEKKGGARVASVLPNSSAAKAKMKPGDIIFELDGKKVTSRDSVLDMLENFRPGKKVTLKVKRGDEDVTVTPILGNRGNFDMGTFQNSMGGALSGRRTGFPMIIQHDTVIRPTDCGGPLVNLDGKVLGLNIARAGRVETWTIPGELVQKIVKDLKDSKKSSPAKGVKEKKPKDD